MAHDDEKTEKEEAAAREDGESDAPPSSREEEDRDDEDEDENEEDDGAAAEAPVAAKPASVSPAPPAHPEPAHAGHAHAADHGHGLAHVLPLVLLFGVLGALLVLTIVTVAVTGVDLGAQGNLVVAMVIATIKAGLVVAYFMHLRWDNKFHLILFLTSVLFLILFLSVSTTDRDEYQRDLDYFTQQQELSK